MSIQGEVPTALRMFMWATPKPGMTLDELIEHMADIGNEVLEVDRVGNRLKLVDVTERLNA